MSDEHSNLTFLVGAGLVVDAGLPTANGLTTKFRDYLRTESASRPTSDFSSCLSVYNLLVGGIRFQDGVLNRDPDGSVNIERLATAALYLQKRFESPLAPYVSGWHQRLLDIECGRSGVLARFLELMFTKLDDWLTPPDPSKLSYLARFNDFCIENWNIDIFSLNYDLCIETALTDLAQRSFENGFDEKGWNPSRLTESALRLIKLHGSLDWVEDHAFGICSLKYPRYENAEDIEGNQPPLLTFGTDSKMTGRDPFLTLLYLFSSRLNSTDLLITIGYSFGDDYLNQVIEQRLISNTRLRVIVVCPDADAVIRPVRCLVGNPRVTTLNESAEPAFQRHILLKEVRALLAIARDEEPFK